MSKLVHDDVDDHGDYGGAAAATAGFQAIVIPDDADDLLVFDSDAADVDAAHVDDDDDYDDGGGGGDGDIVMMMMIMMVRMMMMNKVMTMMMRTVAFDRPTPPPFRACVWLSE